MNTQDLANRLVELCRVGDYKTAYAELYSPDIISVWPKWSPEEVPCIGIDNVLKKSEQWSKNMEQFLWWRTSDPLVAGNFITLTMWFKCIYTWNTEVSKEEEVCVYEVADGKIIREWFFYSV